MREAERIANAKADAQIIAEENARMMADEREAARKAAEQAWIAFEIEYARMIAEQKRSVEEAEVSRLAELSKNEAKRLHKARLAAEKKQARLEVEAKEAEQKKVAA